MDKISDIEELDLAIKFKRISILLSRDSKRAFNYISTDFDSDLFPVLHTLSLNNELSVKKLSEILNISHPAIVQKVNKLIKKKLVETYDYPADKRITIVKINDNGKKLYETFIMIAEKINAAYKQIITEVDPKFLLTLNTLEEKIKSKSIFDRVIDLIKDEQIKKIKVVRYHNEHKETFKQLNLEWLNKYFEVEDEDLKALNDPESYYVKNGGEIFFAIIDENIAGTCAIKKTDKKIFELSKMAVSEKYQGNQVGKKLALTAIGYAYEKGAERIFLETSPKLKAAINLYKKLGFEIVSENFPTHYKRELFRMELKLK
jgi:ribosomal protein S18 acetylase RimI-like enzyme/DNA-binding MarR family transcriptional regulator